MGPSLESGDTGDESASKPAAGKVDRFAPLVAGALLAVPSLAAHYLPMSDLALHEGAVGLLRHFGDDTYAPHDLYRLNLGHPNQLFYIAAWILSYAVGTMWAVKIVIALAQFMIFWTGARLADHLGRSRWGALLLAPLALGFTYFWGMTANLLGFAALLGVLPAIDRAADNPRPRGIVTVCGLLLLTFFAHESIFMAVTAFVALLALAHPLELRKTSMRFAPVVLATALAIGHQIYSTRFFTGAAIILPPSFPSPWQKLLSVPTVLFGSHDLIVRLTLTGLSVLALALLVYARVRPKKPAAGDVLVAVGGERPRLARVQAFLLRYRYELTGFGFLTLYFVMPFNWRGATILYERFLGPAWALFVICAAPRSDTPRLAKLVGSVVPIGILLVSWPQFADADATFRNLDVIIAAIPKNSSVALAVLDRPIYRTRVYSASVGPARTVAERGGRFGLSLAMSPIAPVQVRPQYRWDEFDRRTVASGSRSLQPAHDLNRFGWVIAQSRDVAVRDSLIEAFKPDADVVMIQGEWLLFRSTHPQIPLTSPDARPDPRAETILDRMKYLLRLQHQRWIEKQDDGSSVQAPSNTPDETP
jgi:hypothetical protein